MFSRMFSMILLPLAVGFCTLLAAWGESLGAEERTAGFYQLSEVETEYMLDLISLDPDCIKVCVGEDVYCGEELESECSGFQVIYHNLTKCLESESDATSGLDDSEDSEDSEECYSSGTAIPCVSTWLCAPQPELEIECGPLGSPNRSYEFPGECEINNTIS